MIALTPQNARDAAIALATASTLAMGIALVAIPSAAAFERGGSVAVTGPGGTTTVCDHSAGGGSSATKCTGPGGHTASTGASTTVNGDGTVTRNRASTGPRGRTGATSATFSR